MKKRNGTGCILAGITLLIAISACDSTDCPINNVVYSTYGFYAVTETGESKVRVTDTLTVTAAGTDSVLINRLHNGDGVELPVSYSAETDTVIFQFTDELQRTRKDTIWINKENIPHYESPNCPTSMFHYVTSIRCTHVLIDSVTVVNPNINYHVSENFKIYFRSSL
ncbi:DUF6452 family protein [Phocaeicola sartorii]|uniref:DUF6452 family protein n=1 Tax=Phocaeicola sartorii TaxID=671267 RepID=UPI00272CE771|nr:DUF6452 family protein [Phocaeicola sartorii]